MAFALRLLTISAITSSCLCQYYQPEGRDRDQGSYQQPRPQQEQYYRESALPAAPPPQILSHKQALNHDGNFKYAFAAENGLAQGEVIAPDGSRNGGYTYIDPNGKKISVKYTAGKEGFRIIEGDHIPQPPPHAAAAAQAIYSRQPNYNYEQDDGQYRPAPQYHEGGAGSSPYTQPRPGPQRSAQPIYRPEGNALENREAQYPDHEPGKPHSFGNGYSFAFGG